MGIMSRLSNDISGSIFDPAGLTNYMRGNKSGQKAAQGAADVQTDYGNQSLGLQKSVYDQSSANNKPYIEGGLQDYQNLRGQVNGGAFNNPTFNPTNPGSYQAPAAYQDPGFSLAGLANDPGYQFRLNQGLSSVQNSAAARGMLHSGNTLAGLNDYAQGFASNEANNAFQRYANQRDFGQAQNVDARNFGANRFDTDRTFNYGLQSDVYNSGVAESQRRFGNLATMAGYGPQATAAQSGLGQSYANQAGTTLEGIGNAKAAGLVGAANAQTAAAQGIFGLGGTLLGMYAGRGGKGGNK